MLNKLQKLGIVLNKNEQKSIRGGGKVKVVMSSCSEIWVCADCCHPNWTSCGFGGSQYCINGTCIL